MKKIYSSLFLFSALITAIGADAQCGAPIPEGTATNMFTQIRDNTNPVAADKTLNTVVFIHRQNTALYSGNSGNLRYDLSTNGGASWTTDIGVLNPVSTNYARYPNAVIYNPASNTSTAAAYMGYLAGTINSVTSVWNGMVTGVTSLTSTSSTENYNQPAVSPNNVPGSLVKGAPGVFWSVDVLLNSSNLPTGFTIYKGVWSGTDITWSSNYSATPSFNTSYAGVAFTGDYNIAFDPTGTYGWMSFLGHLSSGPSGYAYYPVFYQTTNGGSTWTGPIEVDLNQFNCMTGNIATGNIVSAYFDHDLVVDANGNPHMLTTIGNGSNYYSVYFTAWHHMFDITMNATGQWVAYDLANVNAGRGSWGTGANYATMDMTPQAARSADGNKLFFGWTDNSAYTLGAANQIPDLYVMGYDVQQQTYTAIKNVSSCSVTTAGKMFFPHFAEEVLEPSTGVYKVAPVYAEFTSSALDPGVTSNFNFLNNVTFSSSEFTVAQTNATIQIAPGNTLLACPGGTTNLSLTGGFTSISWSNGYTTSIAPITSPGTYSVLTTGCGTSTASVVVSNLTFTPSVLNANSSVCPGNTATLSVSGTANGYTWAPGGTGTMALVNPNASTVYTLTAQGYSCTSEATVAVTVYTPPTISISGYTAVCPGATLTEMASGAATYSWSSGDVTPGISYTLDTPTSYSVTGIDNNGCTGTAMVSILIYPSPTIAAVASYTSVCSGKSAMLTASGADFYSWNTGDNTPSVTYILTASADYTVIGTDNNGCSDTANVSVNVFPNPTVTVNSTRPAMCKGETATITVQGAHTYSWSNGVTSTVVVALAPTADVSFTITGTDVNGCQNTAAFTETVSACTGISTNSNADGILIYPNPSTGRFTITNSNNDELQATLYNTTGQKLRELHFSESTELNLESEAAGIYFITVNGSGRAPVTLRLIKQ